VCASVEAELQSVFDVLLLVLGGRALDSSQLSLLLSAGWEMSIVLRGVGWRSSAADWGGGV